MFDGHLKNERRFEMLMKPTTARFPDCGKTDEQIEADVKDKTNVSFETFAISGSRGADRGR